MYTKTFSMNADDKDKNVYLEFEGVYQNAFVYVNNSFAGKCPYGYSNFYVDITKYLNYNEPNALKVVVKNGVPSGRWYTGGGIYRDVNLMIADRLHLAPDSVQLAALKWKMIRQSFVQSQQSLTQESESGRLHCARN